MNPGARLASLIRGDRDGHRALRRDALAINLSYVLHERSDSNPVRSAVDASVGYRELKYQAERTILDGDPETSFDTCLSVSLGSPDGLSRALRDAGVSTGRIWRIDDGERELCAAEFFRGSANLNLPSHHSRSVGIAVLVVRPGRSSHQLIVRGPFDWHTERANALRALESIIQAHVEQWKPEMQLWEEPAEVVFPDEFPTAH